MRSVLKSIAQAGRIPAIRVWSRLCESAQRAGFKQAGAIVLIIAMGLTSAAAGETYIRSKTPVKAEPEHRHPVQRHLDNFVNGVWGLAEDVCDGVRGTAGVVIDTVGMSVLLVSDIGGFIDDNDLTRPIFKGFVSTKVAELGLVLSNFGTEIIEVNHDLDVRGLPLSREVFLRENNADGSIDYVHVQGWQRLLCSPSQLIMIVLSDGFVRPSANILRMASCPEADKLEEHGIHFIESVLCAPEAPEPQPKVVEKVVERIREVKVPVERTVVKEVVKTTEVENFHLRDVLFDYNKATLTPEGHKAIKRLMDRLRGRQIKKVEICGYTCDLGSEDYNLELGKRRAEAVAQAMIELGIDKSIIKTSSKGEADPIVPNRDEVSRALNRRVEVVVTSEKTAE